MLMTPCIQCGELSHEAYCQDHRQVSAPKTKTTAQRGYGARWQRLSKRARRIQPFCSDCGTTENLTLDHSPRAWERYYTGKNIRLIDTNVLCMDCNISRGAARGDRTRGVEADDHLPDPPSKAKFMKLWVSDTSEEVD